MNKISFARNLEYHLSQGVDFIIATDNRSVDPTTEILKWYEARGLLRYIFEGADDYNQHVWVTRMARMAYTEFGADWVINNDADEFWWPMQGSLREAFARLPPEINIVKAQRHNFVAAGQAEKPFFNRMVYRQKVSLNVFGDLLPPKVAHRGCASIKVAQGNHAVDGIDCPNMREQVIEIMHFPVRTAEQIENKIAKGGAAYKRNRDLSKSLGSTWRKLFDDLNRDKDLKRYFADNYYDGARLARSLNSGELVVDKRLSDYFSKRLSGEFRMRA